MSPIILPGDPTSVSFNDDSSPHTHTTSGLKVVVEAQVLTENSLDWYYRILFLCQNVPGELKSTDVWPRFHGIFGENSDRIWNGLSKVRIHITDPRPYQQSYEEILGSILRTSEPMKFLQSQVEAGDPHAKWLSQYKQEFMAKNILSDSMAARVYRLSRVIGDIPSYGQVTSDDDQIDDDEIDDGLTLKSFGTDRKPLVRKVTTFASKSAATFHDALDAYLELGKVEPYSPNPLIQKRMESRVLASHTFDIGDKQVQILEKTRENILNNLQGPYFQVLKRPREIVPYELGDSKQLYPLQASDIAAGIVSKIIETENLVAVVKRFEYVTYNGARLSMTDAEETVRKMTRR